MVDKLKMCSTDRDLAQRIQESFVLYKGSPFYVTTVESLALIRGCFATEANNPDRKLIDVRMADPDLDINPFKIGYTQYVGMAFYLVRRPLRSTKIGLTQTAVTASDNYDGYGLGGVLTSQGFTDSIRGEFPNLDAALGMLTSPKTFGVPLSRLLAIKRRRENKALELWHRGVPIGVVQGTSLVPTGKLPGTVLELADKAGLSC